MSRGNWILLFTLSLLWAAAFLAVDWILQYIPPLTVVLGRTAMAAGLIAIALRVMGIPLPKGRQWGDLAVLGLINAALPFSLLTVAQQEISGALVAILNAMLPITTLISLKICFGTKLGPYRIGGVLTGLLGVAVMMQGVGGGTVLAIVFCLGASTTYAVGQIWTMRISARGLQPMQVAFGQIFWAAVFMLPASLLLEHPWTLPMPPLSAWAMLAGVALFSTALGYIIYFRLIASAGPLATSLVTLVLPPMAVGLSMLVFGVTPKPQHLAGMALILSGLVLIEAARRRELPKAQSRPNPA